MSERHPQHGFLADSSARGAAEIDEEFRFHLESAAADERVAGLSEEDARAAAVRAFGEVSKHRDACLRVAFWSTTMKKSVKQALSKTATVVALLFLGVFAGLQLAEADWWAGDEWERVGAFAGFEWVGDTPVVLVEDRWWVLETLQGVEMSEVLAFSEATYGQRGQKRIAEDLHEVLAGMGLPTETVDATLRDPDTGETSVRSGLPMNEEMRLKAKARTWIADEQVPPPPQAL